jgi:hypothetical protein
MNINLSELSLTELHDLIDLLLELAPPSMNFWSDVSGSDVLLFSVISL